MVQYFDKSRMELTNPYFDTNIGSCLTNVTNGLLTVELVSGFIQVGENSFTPSHPACILVTGDFG